MHASSTVGGAASIAAKERTIDVDASADQADTLPGPADLLTAAFAACVLKTSNAFPTPFTSTTSGPPSRSKPNAKMHRPG